MPGEFGPVIVESRDDDEESQDDSKIAKKKRKISEGFSNWSEVIGVEPEEKEKSEGAFEKAWKWLLDKLTTVEKFEPEGDESAKDIDVTPDQLELPSIESIFEDEPRTPAYELTPDDPEGTLRVRHDDEGTVPETASDNSEPPGPPSRPVSEAAPSPEEPEPAPSDTNTILNQPVEPPTPRETLPPNGDMISPAFTAETSESPTVTHKETIIDRRAGWGPALIVDQLARRRDRKQKRQIKQQKRESKKIDKRLAQTEQLEPRVKQLENLSRTSSQQMEALQAQTQRFERQTPKIEQIENKQNRQLETQKQNEERFKAVEKNTERHIKPPEVAPPLPEITPEAPPVVVMQEVAEAAERNAPLESAYEHRAEVRDESRLAQNNGATSVGAVLADLPTPVLAQQKATSSTHQSSMLPPQLTSVGGGRSVGLYKKAAMSGFWSGVVILAILIVIAIVS